MQEEVEMRTVTLIINGGKLTGRTLKSAVGKLLAYMRSQQRSKDITPYGKQSVRQLISQNQGVSNIEITDPSVRDFERIARKYGVDFAVKKVRGDKPKYLVFFKARDADALTAAFAEYTDRRVRKKERPSVLDALRSLKVQMAARNPPARNRDKELSR